MGRIIFKCRACNDEIMYVPAQAGAARCPQCGKEAPVRPDESLLSLGLVQNCVSCGHDAFYVQKDFNRGLGLAVVAAGVFGSLFFFSRTEPFYAMLCLLATAALDLLIYSFVGDVTVCYSCHAVYRGFRKNPGHERFDLKRLEKYGGRDTRF